MIQLWTWWELFPICKTSKIHLSILKDPHHFRGMFWRHYQKTERQVLENFDNAQLYFCVEMVFHASNIVWTTWDHSFMPQSTIDSFEFSLSIQGWRTHQPHSGPNTWPNAVTIAPTRARTYFESDIHRHGNIKWGCIWWTTSQQ